MLESAYPQYLIEHYNTAVPGLDSVSKHIANLVEFPKVICSNTVIENLSILDVGTGTRRTLINTLRRIPLNVIIV